MPVSNRVHIQHHYLHDTYHSSDNLQAQNDKNLQLQAELHSTIDGLKEFC